MDTPFKNPNIIDMDMDTSFKNPNIINMELLKTNITEEKMHMYSVKDCPKYIQDKLDKSVVSLFEYSISLMLHNKKMSLTNPNHFGKSLPVCPIFSHEYVTNDIKDNESPLMMWFRLINETVSYISNIEKIM